MSDHKPSKDAGIRSSAPTGAVPASRAQPPSDESAPPAPAATAPQTLARSAVPAAASDQRVSPPAPLAELAPAAAAAEDPMARELETLAQKLNMPGATALQLLEAANRWLRRQEQMITNMENESQAKSSIISQLVQLFRLKERPPF